MSTFKMQDLTALTRAPTGFTLWHYKAGEAPIDVVAADGFFNPADYVLRAGDMIMVSASDGGVILYVAPTPGKTLRLA
jgi:hypothetical protein